jgi:hypothetical protein
MFIRRIYNGGAREDSNRRVPVRGALLTARVAVGSGGCHLPAPDPAPLAEHPAVGGQFEQSRSAGQVVDGRFGAESLGCISVAVQRGRRAERSPLVTVRPGPRGRRARERDKRGRGAGSRRADASGRRAGLDAGVGEVR